MTESTSLLIEVTYIIYGDDEDDEKPFFFLDNYL